jgi:ABC-type branched-subunit amino acid transport system substrate-binding protein
MTSVPSLRLPLNGNNLLLIFLLIFGISSCAAKKLGTSELKPPKAKNAEVVPIQTPTAGAVKNTEDSATRNPVIFDLDKSSLPSSADTRPVVKPETNPYNIAVILPFFLDQIPIGKYADDTTKQLSGDSKIAMDFYLGCQMAREKFSGNSINANVYFLDDKNEAETLEKLFTQKPFPQVNYIIGSFSAANTKTLADFAKQHEIVHISPVHHNTDVTENPFYFNANASQKGQYAYLLDIIKKSGAEKLEIIYDSNDSLTRSTYELQELARTYFNAGAIKFISVQAFEDAGKLLTQADTLSERAILFYSSKDTYIKSVLSKLKPVKNPLKLYAPSAVRFTKSLVDSKYPHTVFMAYPYTNEGANYSVFEQKYEEKYVRKPSELSFQGYDLMLYLFNILENKLSLSSNGNTFSNNFDNCQTKFEFKPVLNKNGAIDYYDNTFMYLYRYVNGNFELTTP